MKTDSKNGREHIMQQGNDSGVADFSGMLNEMTLKFMSEGVLGFNPEGIIVYANPAAVFITGISEEELPGSNLLMLFPEADRREMQGVLGKMDDACGPFPRIFRTRRNGKQISIKILPVEKEGCRFAIAILNDVSHHLRMEAQIQRAEKMEAIGTLAGVVAHDLNNILSGLVSYPELLLLQLPQGNPLRKPIHTIQKAGEKAAAVVQDLLTLARRGIVVSDVVNFNDVLIEHLKSPEYEKLLQDHPKVHLQTRLAKNLTHISGSPAHLSKTIVSLISNAVVAMPDGGDILVSTENRYLDKPIRGYSHVVPGDYVVLNVSDTGTGLSTEDVERIFEPFYTKKKMGRSGTGLGMAVVWGVVEDHKGYIDVQNRQGRGTVFTLYFPAIPRELPEDKTGLSISSIMGNGESILIVDDVREQREVSSAMLQELGYAACSVASGEEAVKFLETGKVDLLLLDMVMEPGMDGLDTYRKILELHPGQKAIIASGFSETDRVSELQRLGAGVCLKKPFLLKPLGLAVKEELEK